MSKLIVDMEMPKSCPCDLVGIGYDMCCSAASGIPKRVAEFDECVKNGTKPDWCPIVGVLPEQHGDLVDRDEVKQKMIHYGFRAIDMTATEFCEDELQTVIAAERKDNEQIH